MTELYLDGGGDPDFEQIDEYLRTHFGARAVYRSVLERIEWIQQFHNGQPECPSCHGYRDSGHRLDCQLRALLYPDDLPYRSIGYTAEECEREMRKLTNGERGCSNPDEHFRSVQVHMKERP